MKNSLMIVGMVLLSFASCKKDYTCHCVTKEDDIIIKTETTVIHDTKDNANAECSKAELSTTQTGTTITKVCNID